MAESGARATELARVIDELERLVATRRAYATVETHTDADVEMPAPAGVPRHSGRMLGTLLVTRGYLMEHELSQVLALQARTHERLGEIVVRLGLVRESDIVELLAEQHKIDTIDLDRVTIDPAVATWLPGHEARSLGMIPIRQRSGCIDVAIADPTDSDGLAYLARRLGSPICPILTTRSAIVAAIDRCFPEYEPAEPAAS